MTVLCSRIMLFFLELYYSYGTASLILIQNAGFETDTNGALADKTYAYDDPIISHWTKYNPNLMATAGAVGIANPTTSSAFSDPLFGSDSPEGNQYAYTDQQSITFNTDGEFGIYQTLTDYVVTENITYTLNVFVGNEAQSFWYLKGKFIGIRGDTGSLQGYRVQLLADGEVLSEDDNGEYITQGQWALSTVSITIAPGNIHIGKTLGIRLIHKVRQNTYSHIISFDDVRLDAILPTQSPTNIPTISPSIFPSNSPNQSPTRVPSKSPTEITKPPTFSPTESTKTPSVSSINPTLLPTSNPTMNPTVASRAPLSKPTMNPTLPPVDATNNPISEYLNETETLITTSDIITYTKRQDDNHIVILIATAVILFVLCCVRLCIIYCPSYKSDEKIATQIHVGTADDVLTPTAQMVNALTVEHDAEVNIVEVNGKQKQESLIYGNILNTERKNEEHGEDDDAPLVIEGSSYEINESGTKEVQNWLESIGLEIYFDVFINNAIDSMSMIEEINDKSDLLHIGITLKGHQIKLMNNINKLK